MAPSLLLSLPGARTIPHEELIYETELGQGAFGVVYRVLHKVSGGIYAAKVLKVSVAEFDEVSPRAILYTILDLLS